MLILNQMTTGDCLSVMRDYPDNSVDLVFGSPPYEDARTYDIDFNLKNQAWVDWMVPRVVEAVRVCRGLVAMVVEGRQRNYRWSATPALLMADLHRAGIHLRKPAAFHRVGISGGGQRDWLRNDWEFVLCCTSGGKLPWADNTVMGHSPKHSRGGCSNRTKNGRRQNEPYRINTKRRRDGTMERQKYVSPKLANPGNVIHCPTGWGKMGHPLAHDNEAAFPESLAEFFVRSFCPPGGIVLDPFSGSGTTCAVAERFGRRWAGIDIRATQSDLGTRRVCGCDQYKET